MRIKVCAECTSERFRILRRFIRTKRPGNNARDVVIVHDNALDHRPTRHGCPIARQIASSSVPTKQIQMRRGHETDRIEITHRQTPPRHACTVRNHRHKTRRRTPRDHPLVRWPVREILRRDTLANRVSFRALG